MITPAQWTSLYTLGVRTASVVLTADGTEIEMVAPGATTGAVADQIISAATNANLNAVAIRVDAAGTFLRVIPAVTATYTVKLKAKV